MSNDFLQFIESMDARDADVMNRVLSEEKDANVRFRSSPQFKESFDRALQLVADVTAGRKPSWRLQEAMGVSQFPLLFGGVLERKIVGSYTAAPSVWRQFAGEEKVADFRKVKPLTMEGIDGALPKVKPQGEYPLAEFKEGNYEYFVEKFGRVVPFSWESSINDDLQIIRKVPGLLGTAAARTEDKAATALATTATGPNASFFTEGRGNLLTGALTQTNLEAAFAAMAYQANSAGEPIINTPSVLMVPPALEITAKKLINATQIAYTAANEKNQIWGTNIFGGLKICVNQYLPLVCTDANIRNKQWYLLADPGVEMMPAFVVAKLRGHESPEVFMKSGDTTRVGGGAASPFEGSFENDSIEYKVRHVVGAALGDWRMAVASTGQS